MSKLSRFGVSMDQELLRDFDGLISRKGYPNRSEAIRDIVRNAIMAEETARPDSAGTGTISIVFDHHRAKLSDRLTRIQHDSKLHIYSTTHIHLDRDLCLETIVVKGRLGDIRSFGDQIAALKGVLHAKTFLFSPERL